MSVSTSWTVMRHKLKMLDPHLLLIWMQIRKFGIWTFGHYVPPHCFEPKMEELSEISHSTKDCHVICQRNKAKPTFVCSTYLA